MPDLEPLILAARSGDLAAYGVLVERTQRMVFNVCRQILRRHDDTLDATQETFLRAFTRLDKLEDPAAWPGWVRRIAVNTARNAARKRRFAFTQSDDVPDLPVLDEAATNWSDQQRQSLARAILKLSADDRRLCDRFYHGGWTLVRLAAHAQTTEAAMRKRMQRIRDRLRLEIEMTEHTTDTLPPNLPEQIVALLARPNLVNLPENPVGRMTEILIARYTGFTPVDVPEVVDVAAARRLIGSADYLPDDAIHFVEPGRFLRYDLTLPQLIAAEKIGPPARLRTTGPVYRNQSPSPTRDQAFHQLELLTFDRTSAIDPWHFMGQTLQTITDLLPGRTTLIEPVTYPTCARAWEIAVEVAGKPVVVLSWGIYTDAIVHHLGGDPAVHTAVGLGFGLERMAAIHFNYDDIRKLAAERPQ